MIESQSHSAKTINPFESIFSLSPSLHCKSRVSHSLSSVLGKPVALPHPRCLPCLAFDAYHARVSDGIVRTGVWAWLSYGYSGPYVALDVTVSPYVRARVPCKDATFSQPPRITLHLLAGPRVITVADT